MEKKCEASGGGAATLLHAAEILVDSSYVFHHFHFHFKSAFTFRFPGRQESEVSLPLAAWLYVGSD